MIVTQFAYFTVSIDTEDRETAEEVYATVEELIANHGLPATVSMQFFDMKPPTDHD